MQGKDLKELANRFNDEDEVIFYVWDYEYGNDEPYEVGSGALVNIEGKYINIGVHK